MIEDAIELFKHITYYALLGLLVIALFRIADATEHIARMLGWLS